MIKNYTKIISLFAFIISLSSFSAKAVELEFYFPVAVGGGGSMTSLVRVITVSQAYFTHDVDAQAFDFMTEFRTNQFHNHASEANVLIFINLGR